MVHEVIDMEEKVSAWVKKVEHVKEGYIDLSREEDLSIALMNLISLEEHFYFTAVKTNEQKYLELLQAIRQLRTKLLGMMVTDPQGEEWCISKHLLAASMRLIEVGTKELSRNNTSAATAFFKAAFELYSLFFALNLETINLKEGREVTPEREKKEVIMQKVSDIVKKIINCCKEW